MTWLCNTSLLHVSCQADRALSSQSMYRSPTCYAAGQMEPAAEFLVGATTIVFPSVGLPLLAGSAVYKLGRGWKRKRSDTKNSQESQQPETGSVTLRWDHVNCQITSKKGLHRQLLTNQHGQANPGRQALASRDSGPCSSIAAH